MNKLIISLLLITTFTSHIIGMKRPHPTFDNDFDNAMAAPISPQRFLDTIISQRARYHNCIQSKVDENYEQMLFQPLQIKVWKKLPQDLAKKILLTHFTDTFNTRDTIETAHNHIVNMSKAFENNKEFYDHIHSPQTTLTILYNICGTLQPIHFAERVNTPGMKNYLDKSNALYAAAQNDAFKNNTLDSQTIKQLISEGADPNYMPLDSKPLLYWLLNNYENTKTLLELGANIDVEVESDVHEPSTVLTAAILMNETKKEDLSIIKLLLSYNPHNKCLDAAILSENQEIIQLILQHGVPKDQLIDATNNTRKFLKDARECIKIVRDELDKFHQP